MSHALVLAEIAFRSVVFTHLAKWIFPMILCVLPPEGDRQLPLAAEPFLIQDTWIFADTGLSVHGCTVRVRMIFL